jgi:hypothetical protein
VYADAAHSIEHISYSREAEQIFVTQEGLDDLAAMIIRLLGLNKENTRIDKCTYDANSMLLTARLRVFDTKVNTLASTEGGVAETGTIAEYLVDSLHYGANRLQTMTLVKE